jgi:Carbonic anhydrase
MPIAMPTLCNTRSEAILLLLSFLVPPVGSFQEKPSNPSYAWLTRLPLNSCRDSAGFGTWTVRKAPSMNSSQTSKLDSVADQGLQKLMEGNQRFLRGEARFPTVCKETLADLAKGQQPFAAILGCSDSRVPPELIFDANFGELFIVRVAGNVISPEVMGSLQYAGSHLHTPLFVVLGHEGCGAVKADAADEAGWPRASLSYPSSGQQYPAWTPRGKLASFTGGPTDLGRRSQCSLVDTSDFGD